MLDPFSDEGHLFSWYTTNHNSDNVFIKVQRQRQGLLKRTAYAVEGSGVVVLPHIIWYSNTFSWGLIIHQGDMQGEWFQLTRWIQDSYCGWLHSWCTAKSYRRQYLLSSNSLFQFQPMSNHISTLLLMAWHQDDTDGSFERIPRFRDAWLPLFLSLTDTPHPLSQRVGISKCAERAAITTRSSIERLRVCFTSTRDGIEISRKW